MRRAPKPLRRLRSERGQTAAEYLGVVVFLVLVIGAIFAYAPGIGETLGLGVREQVENIASPGSGDGAGGGSQPGNTLPRSAAGPEAGGEAFAGARASGEVDTEEGGGLLDTLGDAGGAVLGGLTGAASGAAELATGAFEAGGDLVGGAGDLLSGGAELAGDLFSGGADLAGELFSGAGTILSGAFDGGVALVNGFVLGDFGGPYDNAWLEGARAVGQFASGVLIFGDVRDGASAIGEIISSGGRDGWGNLGLSVLGVVPIVGDAAKGIKGVDGIVDVARAGDNVRDGARAADDAPRPRPRGACPSSFTARTPVLMAGGARTPISEVEVGDRVLAADPETGEAGPRAVVRLIRSEGEKTLVRVRVGGRTITATDQHPFWVEGEREWRDAEDLRAGDVLTEPGGERTAVESVRVLEPEPERVFNLTVAGLHTYYAGEAPVLVHNAGCADDLVRNASQVRGRFPDRAQPGETLVRRDPRTREVTYYQVYGDDGMPLRRVDLVGKPHGGVPTPHVVEFERHTNPRTGETFVRKQRDVRPADPDEIPSPGT